MSAKTTKKHPVPPQSNRKEWRHSIVFFAVDDLQSKGLDPFSFLESCHPKVRARLMVYLIAVADAPPLKFAGGGYWEAMHGDMTGWFEVRADGPDKFHYRLFCRLDYEAANFDEPLLAVIAGMKKKFRTVFSSGDYEKVKTLGKRYFADNPRNLRVTTLP